MTDLIDTTEMYLRTILELEEEGIVPLRARISERLGHSGPTVSQTVGRMERDGHLVVATDEVDRRSRIVTMTDSGRHVWQVLAQPKIRAYYEEILGDFSTNDVTHTLHYLLKMLENMQRLDQARGKAAGGDEP